MRPILGLVALLGLVGGCLPPPPAAAPLAPDDAARLLARMGGGGPRTLSALADATLTTAAGRLAFREVVSIRGRDHLRLETWAGPAGLQALVVARGGGVEVYLPGRRGAVSPDLAPRPVRRLLPPGISAADLAALLAGRPPLPAAEAVRSRGQGTGTVVELLRAGRPRVRVVLDDRERVLAWERLDRRGRSVLSVRFHDFREVDGVRLPGRIVFRRPGAGTLELTYISVRVNLPLPDRLFAPPETVP